MHTLIILHCLTLVCLTFVKADFYTTSPVGETTWKAGQTATISWIDGKNPPSLSTIKKAKIYLCTGSDTNQTCPHELATIDPVTPEGGSTNVKVPDNLDPGKIWFLKYTADNGQSFWSTRFTVDSPGAAGKSPDAKGPDANGPDAKGPDGKGPDGKGPDSKGPDGKGPNGQGSSTGNGTNNGGKSSNNGDSKSGGSSNSTTDNKTSDSNSSTTSGTFNLGNSQYFTTAMLVVSTLSAAWMW